MNDMKLLSEPDIPNRRRQLDERGKPVGHHTNRPIKVYPPSYYLAAVMRHWNMNTPQLAEAMGLPEEEVTGLLQGTRGFDTGVCIRLAELFGPSGSAGLDCFWWEHLRMIYWSACEAPTVALSLNPKRPRGKLEIVAAAPQDGGE